MKTFTDNAGKTWTVALTIDAAKRVKSLLGVNLLALDEPLSAETSAKAEPLITRLGTDVIMLCDVIYALVKLQADAAEVTDTEFGRALGGDAILAAQTAFYEELIDFFRKLGRADLAKAVESQRRMIELAVQRIETRIERFDLEAAVTDAVGEAEAETTPGAPSTNSPASSG